MKLLSPLVGMFLYFPEDKTEYIPAAITCVIFLLLAILTMYIINKISQKEALKTKHLEEEVTKRNKQWKKDSLR